MSRRSTAVPRMGELMESNASFLARYDSFLGTAAHTSVRRSLSEPHMVLRRSLGQGSGLDALSLSLASQLTCPSASAQDAFVSLRDALLAVSGDTTGVASDVAVPSSVVEFSREARSVRELNKQLLGPGDMKGEGDPVPLENRVCGDVNMSTSSATALTNLLNCVERKPMPEKPFSLGRGAALTLQRSIIGDRKMNETARMAQLARVARQDLACTQVFDVGAGKGHLGETLAAIHRLPCVSIDRAPKKHEFAKDRYGTCSGHGTARRPKSQRQQSSSSASSDFPDHDHGRDDHTGSIRVLHEHVQRSLKVGSLATGLIHSVQAKPSVVVGLHTCGALADVCRELAVAGSAKAYVNVPCCYPRLLWGQREMTHWAPRSSLGASLNLQQYFSDIGLGLANMNHRRDPDDLLKWCVLRTMRHAARMKIAKDSGMAANKIRMPAQVDRIFWSEWTGSRGPVSSPAGGLKEASSADAFVRYCRIWCDADHKSSSHAAPLRSLSDDELSNVWCSDEMLSNIVELLFDKVLQDLLGFSIETLLLLDRGFALAEQSGMVVVPAAVLSPHTSSRYMGLVAVRPSSLLLTTG